MSSLHQKFLFERSRSFFRFQGEEVTWGTCQNRLKKEGSTLENLFVHFFFHFLNLTVLYSCIIMTVLKILIQV